MNNKTKDYRPALGYWFLLLFVAFALGALRELVLVPLLGPHNAYLIGTLAVVIVFLGIMVLFVRRMQSQFSARDFWLVGLCWLLMTVSFECLFFHYLAGQPWEELLANYNLAAGRVWVFVLLTVFLGPPVIHKILPRRALE